MGVIGNLFGNRGKPDNPLRWDMHNHILFGIDDGSKTIEQSLQMAEIFLSLGYKEVIATPHIMSDYYRNDRTIISGRQQTLKDQLKEKGIDLKLDIAAEYYMDESFYDLVTGKGDILSFKGNHVLVETSFLNKPMFFTKLIFELQSSGYIPVLAHPERYVYYHDQQSDLEDLFRNGVKFQINLLSIIGFYSPAVKKMVEWLIKNNYYHFLGTDAHSPEQLKLIEKVLSSKVFAKIDFGRVENAGPH